MTLVVAHLLLQVHGQVLEDVNVGGVVGDGVALLLPQHEHLLPLAALRNLSDVRFQK